MIYVDDLKRTMPDRGQEGRFKFQSYCHLFADDLENLHAFAELIGLKRSYFKDIASHPHYILTERMRRKARELGALYVPSGAFDGFCRTNFPAR
jgi:Protein of unknown function (DUF4031)